MVLIGFADRFIPFHRVQYLYEISRTAKLFFTLDGKPGKLFFIKAGWIITNIDLAYCCFLSGYFCCYLENSIQTVK